MTPIEALRTAADAMRRADPAYCAAHQVEQITDGEWDAVLELVEDALDDAPPALPDGAREAMRMAVRTLSKLLGVSEDDVTADPDVRRAIKALRSQIEQVGGGR
jgi:truncated hemoglobin YjbI